MQLEMHQLERRWEHLRLREPHRQRQLMASLAEGGQQSPIIVVPAENDSSRYVVIDGYKRIAALEQLRRDTVEAIVWEISEAEALLLERSLRFSRQECALEQGWLLSEMAQCFGYAVQELARRFDRSVSWVSRRLALVELVPETIQQQVREGRIAAQTAMKYLVPIARRSAQDCERMAAVLPGTGAIHGKRRNCIEPGAKARTWFVSGFFPSRSCFCERSGNDPQQVQRRRRCCSGNSRQPLRFFVGRASE